MWVSAHILMHVFTHMSAPMPFSHVHVPNTCRRSSTTEVSVHVYTHVCLRTCLHTCLYTCLHQWRFSWHIAAADPRSHTTTAPVVFFQGMPTSLRLIRLGLRDHRVGYTWHPPVLQRRGSFPSSPRHNTPATVYPPQSLEESCVWTCV